MDVMLEMFRWLKAEDERSDVDQRFAGKDLPLVYRIAWTRRDYFMIEGFKQF